ncbi:hypothetical protein ACVWXL_006830 [Bradyrhizobium sp. GM22.5]
MKGPAAAAWPAWFETPAARAPHHEDEGPAMNSKPFLAIAFAGLILSACSARYQTPVAMGGDDDDAVCQSRGYAAGSPEYVGVPQGPRRPAQFRDHPRRPPPARPRRTHAEPSGPAIKAALRRCARNDEVAEASCVRLKTRRVSPPRLHSMTTEVEGLLLLLVLLLAAERLQLGEHSIDVEIVAGPLRGFVLVLLGGF